MYVSVTVIDLWLQNKAGRDDTKYFEPWYSHRFKKVLHKEANTSDSHISICPLWENWPSKAYQMQYKKTAMWSIPVESFSSQVNCRSVLSIRNEFEKFSTAVCCVFFMNHCPNSVYTSQILELLSPTFTLNTEQLIMSPNASSTLLKQSKHKACWAASPQSLRIFITLCNGFLK